MKKIKIVFIISIFCFGITKSQNNIGGFLNGPMDDVEKLLEGYMNPFGKWFGSGLNAGWYNTAKPHTFPGFDVTGGVHFITPSNDAMLFKPYLNELIVNSSDGSLPTFLGPNNSTEINYMSPDGEVIKLFESPPGSNWSGPIPMPYLQGSIGLIRNTEILFRLTPKIEIEETKTGFWGIGLKHSIKQWIPGINILPFDLSFVGGYSQLNSNTRLDDVPDKGPQELNFNVNAFNSNLVLSKKVLGFTPYIGFGYQYSISNLSLIGDYQIGDWNGEEMVFADVTDPFDFSFGGVNGFKTNIGARLKLFLFTVHAEWTRAEYDVFSIGIGLNSDIGSKLIGKKIEKIGSKEIKE